MQVRRTRHTGYCWRSKDELMSDILLATPTYGRTIVDQAVRTYINQLCAETRCSQEVQPRVMDNRVGWREREEREKERERERESVCVWERERERGSQFYQHNLTINDNDVSQILLLLFRSVLEIYSLSYISINLSLSLTNNIKIIITSYSKMPKMFSPSFKIYRSESNAELINNTLTIYQRMGCRVSFESHFFHSHLDFFLCWNLISCLHFEASSFFLKKTQTQGQKLYSMYRRKTFRTETKKQKRIEDSNKQTRFTWEQILMKNRKTINE